MSDTLKTFYVPSHVVESGDLTVRAATSLADIVAAQKCRFEVFYSEKGAHPSPEILKEERDFDACDPYATHIIVEHEGKVVATARLILSQNLPENAPYYTEQFYNCDAILGSYNRIMEIGRACVLKDYRRGKALSLVWKYAMSVIDETKTEVCFGCASFSGNDPKEHEHTLSYLRSFNLAPKEIRPVIKVENKTLMRQMPDDQVDVRKALRGIPTLMRGYLKLGGLIADEMVIDYQFNTMFTCIFVDITKIPEETYLNFIGQ